MSKIETTSKMPLKLTSRINPGRRTPDPGHSPQHPPSPPHTHTEPGKGQLAHHHKKSPPEPTDPHSKSSAAGPQSYWTIIKKNSITPPFLAVPYQTSLKLCKTVTACFKLFFQKYLVSLKLKSLKIL